MLKYIPGFILMLVILTGFAYVSPTYAASANVVITQIQAGGAGGALEELVVLYNNSADEVNISDWCIKNKSNVSFACFTHDNADAVYLPGHGFASIASYPLANTIKFYQFSILYTPTNQSSGNIVGGSDVISLVDSTDTVVDTHSWTTSLVGGMLLARSQSPTIPLTYLDTDQSADFHTQSPAFIPDNQIEVREIDPDLCPNIDGRQHTVPDGLEIGMNGECRELLAALWVTEILPNASGSDTGQEFIEIFNPHERTIDLTYYTLHVGPNLEKSFSFPVGSTIAAHSYLSFSNAQIPFSLLNTSSRIELRQYDEVLTDVPSYQDPDEATAWALIDGTWQYTNRLTPGSENLSEGLVEGEKEVGDSGSNLKPCTESQYRSTETNRCRNLVTSSTTTRTPCKENQYRSEETNRCRNIATTSTGPAPCKEGQERNPDTNRCRNIKAMPAADYEVLGTSTSSGTNWYLWAAIGGVMILALAYTMWEWRYELGKLFSKLVGFVRLRK